MRIGKYRSISCSPVRASGALARSLFLLVLPFSTIGLAPGCSDLGDSGDTRVTNDVEVADLDYDGFLDLVLARRRRDTLDGNDRSDVSFVLRDPLHENGWVRTQTLRTGRNPRQAAAVDLDGDGRLEVLAINRSPSDLSIFFADPTAPGYYFPPSRIPVGVRPTSFAMADLDGDGLLDLAFANAEATLLSILFQDPAAPGSFRDEVGIDVGERQNAIAAADVDLDGHVDLVVATKTRVLFVRQDPAGNGVFLPGTEVLVDVRPPTVAVADLNGDGVPDLAIGDRLTGSGEVHILLQDPLDPGAFSLAQSFGTVEKPTKLAIADLDGDARPDIALTSFRSREDRRDEGWVSVLLREASLPVWYYEFEVHKVRGETDSLRIVDLDADGVLDIVVASTGARALYGIPGAPGSFEKPVLLKR